MYQIYLQLCLCTMKSLTIWSLWSCWQSQRFGGGWGNYSTTSSSLSVFLSTLFTATISQIVISMWISLSFPFLTPFSGILLYLSFQQILVTLLLLGALLAVTEGKRRGGKPKKARSGRVGSAITQHQIIILERGRIKTLHFFIEAYMTHSLMLGKFEYTRGPIFKVVLEC